MSTMTARRGRPKGSGIDDRQRLDDIARLVASNPALRPTTAIRSLGISDPSVIRRLRDKFSIVRAELESELKSTRQKNSGPKTRTKPASAELATTPAANSEKSAQSSKKGKPASRAISAAPSSSTSHAAKNMAVQSPTATAPRTAARSPRPQVRSSLTVEKASARSDDDSERHPARAGSASESYDFIVSAMSTGMVLTHSMLATQAAISQKLIQNPIVSLALRQQLAFNQWAVGLVPAFHAGVKSGN